MPAREQLGDARAERRRLAGAGAGEDQHRRGALAARQRRCSSFRCASHAHSSTTVMNRADGTAHHGCPAGARALFGEGGERFRAPFVGPALGHSNREDRVLSDDARDDRGSRRPRSASGRSAAPAGSELDDHHHRAERSLHRRPEHRRAPYERVASDACAGPHVYPQRPEQTSHHRADRERWA